MDSPTENGREPTVLLALENPSAMLGLRFAFTTDSDLKVCGEADDTRMALDLCKRLQPLVVLLDPMMEQGRGFGLLQELRQCREDVRLVFMTVDPNVGSIHRAFEAGVFAYVTQRDATPDVLRAVQLAFSGTKSLSQLAAVLVASNMPTEVVAVQGKGEARLTQREKEVFVLMGRGLKHKEIATKLGISLKTVESHVHNLGEKLHIKGAAKLRAAAVAFVAAQNLVVLQS